MKEYLEKKLRNEIHELRDENNRFRLLIENLYTYSHIQRRSLTQKRKANHISVFDKFSHKRFAKPSYRRMPKKFSKQEFDYDFTWFSMFDGDLAALDPTPGWGCFSDTDDKVVIGIDIISSKASNIEKIVEEVWLRQKRDRDFTPIFITDCSDFSIFRKKGYVFEYIPIFQKNKSEWKSYYSDRLKLITKKWGITRIISMNQFIK